MNNKLYLDILDENREAILPLLKNFITDFYLAGGTALAFQLGHRDSIDFDFFTPHSFSTIDLFQFSKEVFKGFGLQKFQEEN